jgi:hypothetical protein
MLNEAREAVYRRHDAEWAATHGKDSSGVAKRSRNKAGG